MKSKLFSNILVLFISLGGAFYCARLLYIDIYINKSTADGLVEAGIIKEKHETVKRKFSENMLWDMVNNQEKLYWYDSIQTAERSQAIIQLLDGNEIKLGASSLVVLEKDNDQLALNLKSGQLFLDSKEADTKIKVNGVSLKSEQGKTLALNVDTAKGQLTAIQTSADGTGKQIIFKKDGTTEEKELPIALQSPVALFRKNTLLDEEAVTFLWNTKSKKANIEISQDKDFKTLLVNKNTFTTKFDAKLKPGSYFWRVKTEAGQLSEVRSIDIIKMQEPKLIGPTDKNKVSYRKDIPAVEFTWESVENSNGYLIEVARDHDFTNLIVKEETSQKVFKTSKLTDGPVYWRVSSVYGNDRKPSSISQIEIEKLKEVTPPSLLEPAQQFEVNYDYFEQNKGIPFKWDYVDQTTYKFVLDKNDSFESPLVVIETTEKSALIKQPLQPGTYYWALGYKNLDDTWVYKNVRKIKIGILEAPLEAPAFEMEEVQ